MTDPEDGLEHELEGGLEVQLRRRYGLRVQAMRRLDVPVNDVIEVEGADSHVAVKLYHRRRTPAQIHWEAELVWQLARRGAPVAAPIRGDQGLVSVLTVDGRDRWAVVWRWAPGTKPAPSTATYLSLGEAAARIHLAADELTGFPDREVYDRALLIDDQLRRLRPLLDRVGAWDAVVGLTDRLAARLGPGLDRGLCHLDLTLDNVHLDHGAPTAFDFDSAGRCWRAMEPTGVQLFSDAYFGDWLTGYRAVRPFGAADEEAVASLAVLGDIRNTAWKLGVADSSRGEPLLSLDELPAVVRGWLAREPR